MAVASLTYDASLAVEETKSGFFVYDGAPSRFHEWEFRAGIRYLSSKDDDKHRALSSIVEALRGEAALVAMDVGMTTLMDNKMTGFDELLKAMTARVFPQAQAEAKELYQVGHKHRGPLSRQAAEPMISFVSRRRRWWAKLKKLDPTVDLSTSLLGDLMLDAANLGKVEKLMVLTSTGNIREFEKVAEALMGQHAKIHVEEKRDKKHDSHKPSFRRPWSRQANFAEEEVEWDLDDYDYDDEVPAHAMLAEGEEDNECETLDEVELDVFTCLLAQGFAPEAMVPLIQTEGQAFLAKGGGKGRKGKGKSKGKSKGKNRFSSGLKPSLSLEDRKKALTKLKSETKCNDCGEYGHWSGDAICPKKKSSHQKTGMLSLVADYSSKAASSSSCSCCEMPAVPCVKDMPAVPCVKDEPAVPRVEDEQEEQHSDDSELPWANFAVRQETSDDGESDDINAVALMADKSGSSNCPRRTTSTWFAL